MAWPGSGVWLAARASVPARFDRLCITACSASCKAASACLAERLIVEQGEDCLEVLLPARMSVLHLDTNRNDRVGSLAQRWGPVQIGGTVVTLFVSRDARHVRSNRQMAHRAGLNGDRERLDRQEEINVKAMTRSGTAPPV